MIKYEIKVEEYLRTSTPHSYSLYLCIIWTKLYCLKLKKPTKHIHFHSCFCIVCLCIIYTPWLTQMYISGLKSSCVLYSSRLINSVSEKPSGYKYEYTPLSYLHLYEAVLLFVLSAVNFLKLVSHFLPTTSNKHKFK